MFAEHQCDYLGRRTHTTPAAAVKIRNIKTEIRKKTLKKIRKYYKQSKELSDKIKKYETGIEQYIDIGGVWKAIS